MPDLRSVTAAVPSPWTPAGRARRVDDDYIGALGDEITNRLFLVGTDLCSAIGLAADEPVRVRLEHAVAEADEAIKALRHLMLAVREADREDP